MKVYAAIDIGSNAARLLIAEVFDYKGNQFIKKRSLIRVPLRLGAEVFEKGKIPDYKVDDIIKSMRAYKLLMDVNDVVKYKAVATSAMRDAVNSEQIVRMVKEQTGIKIDIITGQSEAKLLYATHFEEILDKDTDYVYIDVGGGSTEISIFEKGAKTIAKSFNIGTIRLLKDQVQKVQWNEMQSWLEVHTHKLKSPEAIGSGGNINKLYKLNGSRIDKKISQSEMKKLLSDLSEFSLEERIRQLNMRQDRADVIIPATRIFYNVMKWGKISEVYVPKFGLVDGIIKYISNPKTKNQAD